MIMKYTYNNILNNSYNNRIHYIHTMRGCVPKNINFYCNEGTFTMRSHTVNKYRYDNVNCFY